MFSFASTRGFDIQPTAALQIAASIQRGDLATMSKFVHRRQFMIEWGHCDPAGIVFNSRFFEYFDWGTWKLFEAALGVKPHELGPTYGIMGIPLVDSGARFIAPARFGDMGDARSRQSGKDQGTADPAGSHRALCSVARGDEYRFERVAGNCYAGGAIRKAMDATAWRAFCSSRSTAAPAPTRLPTTFCCWIICGNTSD